MNHGLTKIDPGGRSARRGLGDVTAAYHTKGDRHPSVDLVWTATFTAAGYGGSFPVTGAVTVAGAPITVHVLEARAELVHPGLGPPKRRPASQRQRAGRRTLL